MHGIINNDKAAKMRWHNHIQSMWYTYYIKLVGGCEDVHSINVSFHQSLQVRSHQVGVVEVVEEVVEGVVVEVAE